MDIGESDTMTNAEVNAAAAALCRWFKGQDISPSDALHVLASASLNAIDCIAQQNDDPAETERVLRKWLALGIQQMQFAKP